MTKLIQFPLAKKIDKYSIPTKVIEIAPGAFQCSNLVEVILPSSLTRIHGAAFLDCTSLKHINIPSSVKFIDSNSFAGCKILKFSN